MAIGIQQIVQHQYARANTSTRFHQRALQRACDIQNRSRAPATYLIAIAINQEPCDTPEKDAWEGLDGQNALLEIPDLHFGRRLRQRSEAARWSTDVYTSTKESKPRPGKVFLTLNPAPTVQRLQRAAHPRTLGIQRTDKVRTRNLHTTIIRIES